MAIVLENILHDLVYWVVKPGLFCSINQLKSKANLQMCTETIRDTSKHYLPKKCKSFYNFIVTHKRV